MTGGNSKQKLFTKNYVILIITALIGGFLMSMFVSTLPIYAERLTSSSLYAGLVTTVFTIASFISRPVAGILCEKRNHVPLLIVGFTVMVIACITYNFAYSIVFFLLLRALHGVGFGIKTTVSGVIVAENIPESRFAEGIGIYNLYLPLTNSLGPVLAFSIIGSGNDISKFKVLFTTGACIGAAAIILSFFIKEKKRITDHSELVETKTASGDGKSNEDNYQLPKTFLGFEKGVIWPSIVLAFMYVGQGAILSFIALYSIDQGLGNAGLFFVVNAIAMFITRFIFAKTVERTGYDIPTILGLLLFMVGLFFIPLSHTFITLYIADALLGIAMGIVPMSINAITLQRCSKQRSGTAMAAYTSAMDIGVGFSSTILGAILKYSSYKCIFFIAAISSLVGAAIYVLTLNGSKKNVNLMH